MRSELGLNMRACFGFRGLEKGSWSGKYDWINLVNCLFNGQSDDQDGSWKLSTVSIIKHSFDNQEVCWRPRAVLTIRRSLGCFSSLRFEIWYMPHYFLFELNSTAVDRDSLEQSDLWQFALYGSGNFLKKSHDSTARYLTWPYLGMKGCSLISVQLSPEENSELSVSKENGPNSGLWLQWIKSHDVKALTIFSFHPRKYSLSHFIFSI